MTGVSVEGGALDITCTVTTLVNGQGATRAGRPGAMTVDGKHPALVAAMDRARAPIPGRRR
ncbi:hypothetical protein [Streptomyces ziwulingensis]|uniref:Uncharacterized protein n=1 Tax=Streptomyces ziwulingensis TaxID=1045501 RepID=A0ABP9CMZ8_9ACTN